MGMDVGGKKGGIRGDINVTPLVDVVLVLLIIFMVLTPSTLKHLTANVPKKPDEPSPPAPTDTSIVVEYSAGREITVNSEPVAVEALGPKLVERLRGSRQKVVFFKADDEAAYGDIVRLMDVARGVGAQTLAVVTE
ncbi:MAG: Biopolymer transport protein ExbD/TolR [Polyangiaceae bacterium]|nr:Biopolymer transport protein ExbD/TolR [Polyangiaceae bacterium]